MIDVVEELRAICPPDSTQSIAEAIAALGDDEYALYLDWMRGLDPLQRMRLEHDWQFWGRPKQQPPDHCADPACGCNGAWTVWLILAGRAFGKSRTGAEWCHIVAALYPGCRIGVVAPTAGDARRVAIEGESGLVNTAKPWNPCVYEPSKTQVRWENGSHALVLSADEPRRFRGPQYHFVWADELAAWGVGAENHGRRISRRNAEEVLHMIKLGLRLPARSNWTRPYRPQMAITTTPLPIEIIRRMAGAPPFVKDPRLHLTVGSTYENKSNLAVEYFDSVIRDLEGTRLGEQELQGRLLFDAPGAKWKSSMIDPFRVEDNQVPAQLKSVIVAVDPAAGGINSTGIIVCASGPRPGGTMSDIADTHTSIQASLRKNQRIHGYVLADRTSAGSPDQWAREVVRAYHEFGAEAVVAESNQGGDMVRYTISTIDPTVPVKFVHASRSKESRAEPIVALSEQGRIHMVGRQTLLEEQLLTWDPETTGHRNSPDRLDAFVWGMYHLLGKGKIHSIAAPISIGVRANPWSIHQAA